MSKNNLRNSLLFLVIIAAASLCGCSSLSKGQLESVAKFAETCDSFSAYPSLIFYELNKLRAESSIWYASSMTIPENRISELSKIYQAKKEGEKIAKGTDLSMNILSRYARALKSLAHNNRVEDPGREIRSTGRAIDTLITTFNSLKITKPITSGIVSTAAKIVAYGAELNASRVRAEALRALIPEGDTLVNQLCKAMESILKEEEVKSLIIHEQNMIKSNYLSYVRIAGSNIDEDRRFIELTERGDALNKLRTGTITSIGSLRRAHNKMALQIEEGISLPDLLADIDEFRTEVEKLYKTTKRWHKKL